MRWTGRWALPLLFFDNSIDPADAPAAGLIASAETQPGICLPAPSPSSSTLTSVSKSKKANGTASRPTATPQMALHGEVIDATAGTYDPSVDGVFSAEAYNDGEVPVSHTSDPTLTRPGLAMIDISTRSISIQGMLAPRAMVMIPVATSRGWVTTCSDVWRRKSIAQSHQRSAIDRLAGFRRLSSFAASPARARRYMTGSGWC